MASLDLVSCFFFSVAAVPPFILHCPLKVAVGSICSLPAQILPSTIALLTQLQQFFYLNIAHYFTGYIGLLPRYLAFNKARSANNNFCRKVTLPLMVPSMRRSLSLCRSPFNVVPAEIKVALLPLWF